MALGLISGHDGGVTLPSMHGGKPFRWTLNWEMRNKNVSGYGDGRGEKHRGGKLGYNGNIGFLLYKGQTATAVNITAPSIDGVTLTLTSGTGCTHDGTALFVGGNIEHADNDPAVGGAYNFLFTGLPAEVWATS